MTPVTVRDIKRLYRPQFRRGQSNTMKIFYSSLITLLVSGAIAFGQGSLTPPGAPGTTMKTLTQLDTHLTLVEPRIAISNLPLTISLSGSYYFVTNVLA